VLPVSFGIIPYEIVDTVSASTFISYGMIYFNNVSKLYNKDSLALDDVTLTVTKGEFVSIVGHSGAGKTTLVKMILADENPTSGTVFFESIDVSKIKNEDLTKLRRRIGAIFQDFKLLNNKTAYENIAFAMESVGKSDQEIKSDVPHVLELVDLSGKMHRFPHQMSGGEQQRLAIARAIINQPELIIADEPTGNLDPVNTFDVVQILKKINDLGTTVILTTHNRGVIESIGKRVVTMEKGKIVRDDKDGKYVI
jgi:cell division transport system ATP-binding protein